MFVGRSCRGCRHHSFQQTGRTGDDGRENRGLCESGSQENFIMKSKLSWREKLEKDQQPKLVDIPPKMARFGKGKLLTPTPMLVDKLVPRIPKGKLVTSVSSGVSWRRISAPMLPVRSRPASFVRIAAEAAEEDRLQAADLRDGRFRLKAALQTFVPD